MIESPAFGAFFTFLVKNANSLKKIGTSKSFHPNKYKENASSKSYWHKGNARLEVRLLTF